MRLKELENWLSASDVARMRGVSRQAIHQQLADGRYRAVKTRIGWLIDPAEADRIKRESSK
jgi:predicted DNA-binding protein (UPF0251 family)